jgi:hypothetical protein
MKRRAGYQQVVLLLSRDGGLAPSLSFRGTSSAPLLSLLWPARALQVAWAVFMVYSEFERARAVFII